MQLFFGGAFAGKRKIVKSRFSAISWLTSYNKDSLYKWKEIWAPGTALVLEGFEYWIYELVKTIENDAEIRNKFNVLFEMLELEERKRNDPVILIMLEIGKGIVPLDKTERRTRDIAGWIAQDAAQKCKNVEYVWNGLSKKIK